MGDRVDGLVHAQRGLPVAGHPAEVPIQTGDLRANLRPAQLVGLALELGGRRRRNPGGCRHQGCCRTCRSEGMRSAGRSARSARSGPRRSPADSRPPPEEDVGIGLEAEPAAGPEHPHRARSRIAESVIGAVAPKSPQSSGRFGPRWPRWRPRRRPRPVSRPCAGGVPRVLRRTLGVSPEMLQGTRSGRGTTRKSNSKWAESGQF